MTVKYVRQPDLFVLYDICASKVWQQAFLTGYMEAFGKAFEARLPGKTKDRRKQAIVALICTWTEKGVSEGIIAEFTEMPLKEVRRIAKLAGPCQVKECENP